MHVKNSKWLRKMMVGGQRFWEFRWSTVAEFALFYFILIYSFYIFRYNIMFLQELELK